MLVSFFNIRGITAPGRKKCLEDTVIPFKVDYIGFQETKKEKFSKSFLKSSLGNRNFEWNFMPTVGTAGGILVGLNSDIFEVISWDIKSFSISTTARLKSSGVVIRLTTVYGSPYEEGKDVFISELHELFLNWDGSAIIGGDFNLVRSESDKINGVTDFKWADKFNVWIDLWALVEIGLAGRSFTWSNNQNNRIMSRIDRIFCNTSFEALFPLGMQERCLG
jgi:exonuclease III